MDSRPLTESAQCFANRRYHEAWLQQTTLAAESVHKSTPLATAVTNSNECSRLYGVDSTTKIVNGRVLEVIVGKTATRRYVFESTVEACEGGMCPSKDNHF